MKKETFLAMSDDNQLKYLNEEAAKGLSYGEICSGIGLTKEELGRNGYYFVKDKFLKKPMKGYGTTQRSGNEKTI
jgi:hypothetical protein